MRFKEVSEGMKVKVYRSLRGEKCFVGEEGTIMGIHPYNTLYPIFVRREGKKHYTSFSHKELKEVKSETPFAKENVNSIRFNIRKGFFLLKEENQKLKNEVKQLRKELKEVK